MLMIHKFPSPEAARKTAGFYPLTHPYALPDEQWMLDNAVQQLERGRIRPALVQVSSNCVELWRSVFSTHEQTTL